MYLGCFFFFSFQSLFNLLEFRRLVLNFNPPANAQDLPRNQKVKLEANMLCLLNGYVRRDETDWFFVLHGSFLRRHTWRKLDFCVTYQKGKNGKRKWLYEVGRHLMSWFLARVYRAVNFCVSKIHSISFCPLLEILKRECDADLFLVVRHFSLDWNAH